MAVGGRLAGAAGGLMNTGANVMGMVNALLVPALVAMLGWQAAMSSVAVAAAAGIVCMLLVRADRVVTA